MPPYIGVPVFRRFGSISIVVSVRPRGATLLPLDGFSWNLIYEGYSKVCRENSGLIKIWQWRAPYMKTVVHLWQCRWILLKMRNVSDKSKENQNTHFLSWHMHFAIGSMWSQRYVPCWCVVWCGVCVCVRARVRACVPLKPGKCHLFLPSPMYVLAVTPGNVSGRLSHARARRVFPTR